MRGILMEDEQRYIYENKIKSLINDGFDVQIDNIDTRLEYELSSIDRISFLLQIEDEFNISYNFERPLSTIRDVVDFIINYKGLEV